MGIRWVGHGQPSSWIPIIQFKLGTPATVVLSADQAFWRTVHLHWDTDLKKNVPCRDGDGCEHFPKPTKLVTYVPAMQWNPCNVRWLQRVLAVNQTMRPMLAEDLDNTVFSLLRVGRFNAPVRWSIDTNIPRHEPVRGFDIEDSLRRAWGIQERVAAPRLTA